jgi:regulator of sirC expression with transglutaminase-like and TPR domain
LNTPAFAPNAEFAAMLDGDDEDIDLMRAALCIAAVHNPQIDPEDSYRRLDELAEQARAEVDTQQSLEEIARNLCHLLYRQMGFSGDSKDYYNPDNSYINRVLETRRGIPISLALIYIEVGKALGLKINGIGFPGHFLLRLRSAESESTPSKPQTESVIIDPFAGQVLSIEDCKDLLSVSSGNTLLFKPEFLNTISKRAILRRMLGNLKAIYLNKADYPQALSLCDRLLLLNSDSVQDRIDRAGVLEKLECYELAAQDLEQLLDHKPPLQGLQGLPRKIKQLRALIQGKPH